jgi:RNA polymerase sigma-70 factor, ECF subfamily
VASDRQLIADVAGGSEVAFKQVYDRFAERIYRYAYSILRGRHLAEEVVQETMIAIWKGAPRFAGRSKVSTWVLGIARNQAYSLIRKETRTKTLPEGFVVEPDPAPVIHRQEQVARALERLSRDHREVVFLTFYEGLSYREIASMLGIPTGTVKSRMFHAKKQLEEALTT